MTVLVILAAVGWGLALAAGLPLFLGWRAKRTVLEPCVCGQTRLTHVQWVTENFWTSRFIATDGRGLAGTVVYTHYHPSLHRKCKVLP